jgi:Bacterial SH3 domain
MATLSFAETSLREHELTHGTENHSPEWSAPALAPIGATAPRHPEVVARKPAVYADEEDLLYGPEEDDLLNGPGQNDLSGTGRSFNLQRKLAAGTAIVAALGVCACAYFFSSPHDKTAPQTAEVSAAVQPALASSVPTALNASGPPTEPDGSGSASSRTEALPAWPVDASREVQSMASQKVESVEASQKGVPVGVSQKVVSASSGTTAEARIGVAAAAENVLFVQRPGVNIRSTPSRSGSAVGTAPKGTRFKVLSREAEWIQVQNGRLKGWINAQFLAPTEPR